MFRHPSYYKKLRERNKSDQTISHANSTRGPSDVRSGPGHKQQASSCKPQASSSMIREPRKSFTVPEPRC